LGSEQNEHILYSQNLAYFYFQKTYILISQFDNNEHISQNWIFLFPENLYINQSIYITKAGKYLFPENLHINQSFTTMNKFVLKKAGIFLFPENLYTNQSWKQRDHKIHAKCIVEQKMKIIFMFNIKITGWGTEKDGNV